MTESGRGPTIQDSPGAFRAALQLSGRGREEVPGQCSGGAALVGQSWRGRSPGGRWLFLPPTRAARGPGSESGVQHPPPWRLPQALGGPRLAPSRQRTRGPAGSSQGSLNAAPPPRCSWERAKGELGLQRTGLAHLTEGAMESNVREGAP